SASLVNSATAGWAAAACAASERTAAAARLPIRNAVTCTAAIRNAVIRIEAPPKRRERHQYTFHERPIVRRCRIRLGQPQTTVNKGGGPWNLAICCFSTK